MHALLRRQGGWRIRSSAPRCQQALRHPDRLFSFASLRVGNGRSTADTGGEKEQTNAETAFEAIKAAHQAEAASSAKDNVSSSRSLAAGVDEQLRAQVEHLSRELRHSQAVIRQLVGLVDCEKHAADLVRLGSTMEGGGGLFIAEDSEALFKALQTPGARIVLRERHAYLLDLYEPVHIRNTSVSIIGNRATIVGSFALDRGATLDLSGVFLHVSNGERKHQLRILPPGVQAEAEPNALPEAARPRDGKQVDHACTRPALSATNGSKLFIHNCTIANGRDGVYLGINASAELCNTSVRNCVRGVFEGVGCHVGVAPDCTFSGNYYQLVLLGPDKRARLQTMIFPSEGDKSKRPVFRDVCEPREVCPPGFRCVTPVWLRRTRADVVLEQDPIQDVYSDCWTADGKPVELDEDHRTANLSDPVY